MTSSSSSTVKKKMRRKKNRSLTREESLNLGSKSSRPVHRESQALILWNRVEYVVYAYPGWRWNLLHVANQLAKIGFQMETVLPLKCSFFGTLPPEVDPEKAFGSLTEVVQWKKV